MFFLSDVLYIIHYYTLFLILILFGHSKELGVDVSGAL